MGDKPAPIVGQVIEARVEFPRFDDVPSVYATNMVVQHTGLEYVISFYNVRPPVDLEPTEPPKTVKANCVARVVVLPERMATFVELFNNHMKAVLEATRGK